MTAAAAKSPDRCFGRRLSGKPLATASEPFSTPVDRFQPADSGDGRLWHGLGLARRLHRLALDLTLSNQPQGQDCADEAQQRAEHEHVVETCEESLVGRVRDLMVEPPSSTEDCAADLVAIPRISLALSLPGETKLPPHL